MLALESNGQDKNQTINTSKKITKENKEIKTTASKSEEYVRG
jgi:hypothetical protein